MSKFITYKNTQIHYTDSGKGTAIVLLHGFLENTTMWQSLETVLTTKYRVICVDLLGHGQSENMGYVHTMNQMAETVKAVLDELHILRCFLVGHSMGGYVSLAFATLFPNHVQGLVLLNSTAKPDTPEKVNGRNRAIAVVKENHKSFIRTSIPMLFPSMSRKIYREEILNLIKEALTTSQQGVIAALEGMKIRKDRVALLSVDSYPKMMILGKKDPVLAYEDLMEQTRNFPVERVSLENGHMSLIEDQEATIQAIFSFLNKY